MLAESVDALEIKSDGVYIDATFGVGGHSELILSRLGESGKLFAYDKDLSAAELANGAKFQDNRFVFKHGSFVNFKEDLEKLGYGGKVNGILFDLGVSSCQLDNAERGFSFNKDGPLDMRMNSSDGITAADWINRASEKEIADTLYQYGDEYSSRRIARFIVSERKNLKITRTLQLANIIASAKPKRAKGCHPATKTFQAIRILINNELGDIFSALENSLSVLELGGKLVVLSFHSGEDRIVKHFVRNSSEGDQSINAKFKSVTKVATADRSETRANPRSRSVKMRVAEKVEMKQGKYSHDK